MSEWKLPALSDEQKDWVIDARACDMTFAEIAGHFQAMYPDYAPDIPEEVLVPLLSERLGQIINASAASAKYFIDAKRNGETPTNIEAIPLTRPHVRLLYLQRLWENTPDRSIQKCIEYAGEEIPVYRYNIKDKLSILAAIRREIEELGIDRSGVYNDGASETAKSLLTGDVGDALGDLGGANAG